MDWFSFRLYAPLTEEHRAALLATSGVVISKRDPTLIFAGENAAWMVGTLLTHWGLRIKTVEHPDWLRSGLQAFPRIADFRQIVNGLDGEYPLYLLPWQRELILNYGHKPGVHAWWSAGAAKTVGTLAWAMLDLGPILYITRSGARRTIVRDVERFTTTTYDVLEGPPRKVALGTRVAIIGWNSLVRWLEILSQWNFTTLVVDEEHRGKNWRRLTAVPIKSGDSYVFNGDGSIRNDFRWKKTASSAAKQLSLRAKRRIGASATPLADRLRDLWGQLDLIEPDMWGKSPYKFFGRYAAGHEGQWGGYESTGTSTEPFVQELIGRLSFVVHKVPYAVTHAGLPDSRRQVNFIPKDELLTDIGPEGRAVLESATHEDGDRKYEAMAHARLAIAAILKKDVIVEEVIDSIGANTKQVVVSGLRRSTEQLHAAIVSRLKKERREVQTWFAHGGTPIDARDRIQDEYMSHPGPCILIGSSEAWGESICLHDTDITHFGMLPFTPRQVEQGEGRYKRQGQRRKWLGRYHSAEGTYDEIVEERLLRKLPAVDKVVGNGALAGFYHQLGGFDKAAEIEASMIAALKSGTYEIDEDDHR